MPTTYIDVKAGNTYTTLNGVLTAIANGTISDAADQVVRLYTIGTQASAYAITGSGVGQTRVNPIVVRVAYPSENGGVALDLAVEQELGVTNVRGVHWDMSGAGASRLRFRGRIYLKGGCHNWKFKGNPTANCGALDGATTWVSGAGSGTFLGNLVVGYGMQAEKLNDDLVIDGVKFFMKRSGTTSGKRGYNTVVCFKMNSSKDSTQSRASTGMIVRNTEFAFYANDGMQILGADGALIEDVWIHDLYPTAANNSHHIDGIHVMQMVDSTVNRVRIERCLYQGLWLKTDNSPATFVNDTTGYFNSISDCVFSNVIVSDLGGPFLEGALDFDGSLTYTEGTATKTYGTTGGQAFGVTNCRKVLLAHCVGVRNFNNAGLEVNYTVTSQRPRLPPSVGGTWLNATSDMDVDIVNCVFTYAATSDVAGKYIPVDPKTLGTWRNNLQTQVVTSKTGLQIVTVKGTGDLDIGTNPNWDTSYVPYTGSPLLNVGYNSTLSTGLPLPAADFAGVTWGTRDIGAYETAGAVATLNADAGVDTTGVVSTAIQLDGSATTSGGTTTWSWAKVSGPGTVTFSSTTAATPTATCSQVGTYVVRLTASTVAAPGTTDTDDVTVVVTAAPVVPGEGVPGLFPDNQVRVIEGVAYVMVGA